MPERSEFYTLKGYAMLESNRITSSMEDYLEMMYRMHLRGEPIQIGKLSGILHVKPSSASKMAGQLKNEGLAAFEKYGHITLTDRGKALGKYLLYRHDMIHRLLRHINQTDNELEQTEKIEHFLNVKTVCNIEKMLDRLKDGRPSAD